MTSPTTTTGIDLAAAVDAAQAWHALHEAAASDAAGRARIDTAASLADAALAAATRAGWLRPRPTPDGSDVVDASAAWARVALLWHQVLTDTDTFTHARSSPPATCRIDPKQIRSWLTGGAGEDTVAATLGLDEYFDLYGFDKWVRITNLVTAAQDAGVFGVPGHRIEILHLAGERGFVDAHRVTLTTPRHGTLCSGDIDTLDLLTDHLSGVDAAVHALTVIAEQTDGLLTDRALLADATWPTPAPTPTVAPSVATAPDQRREQVATDTTVDSLAPTAFAVAPMQQATPVGSPSPSPAVVAPVGRAFRPLALDPAPASVPAVEPPGRNGRRHR